MKKILTKISTSELAAGGKPSTRFPPGRLVELIGMTKSQASFSYMYIYFFRMCICGFVFILVSCFGMCSSFCCCYKVFLLLYFALLVFVFVGFWFFLLKLPAWGSLVFTRKRYNRNAHDQIAKGYVENSTENILQKSYQCKQCQN